MRNKMRFRIFISFFFLFIFQIPLSAQSVTGVTSGMKYFLYAIIFFVFIAFVFTINFFRLNKKFEKAYKIKKGRENEPTGLRKWWSKMDNRFLTKAAPLEKEADVLLDHNYDGIRELDNALPPWWKWGFYITLVVAVIYMFRFHVWHTGPTPEDEYNKEMTIAAARLENIRMNSKEMFDEKTVTMADAKGITDGKKIFTGTCFPCHGANGEGNAVGPNLTDKYWLHGGAIGNIFKTITIGVPDKGMQAWGKTFSPTDIKNLSSFILSLQGSNPANGKAPQGDIYTPAATKDSLVIKKDTVLKK